MTVSKLKLNQELLVEEFFESTWLLGIISSVKDYQLCWQINQQLGFHLRVNPELEIKWEKKKRSFYFTVFEFAEPTKSVNHYLYNNHCKAEFLLPELKHIDYLWLLKGDYYQEKDIRQLVELLRQVGGIRLVSVLQQEELKNRSNLIF